MVVPLLSPLDIIEGASIRGRNGVFVLGCFDQRITFYSQQVRALALIHALADQQYLQGSPRIAVVGGGAAGVSAAAAAALASTGEVVLFEAAEDLLKLQMGTDRRKLDPHIYNWPRSNSEDQIANLPILDWEAGPSQVVREDVVRQFEDIARCSGNLVQQKRHQVISIEKTGADGYELTVYDIDQQQERTDYFQIVIFAFGFGLENTETIPGINDKSYWDNAGIPGAEFRGRPRPHYFISGNGDGGLIDFVAAASADFNHAAMIQIITGNPTHRKVERELLSIEDEARRAQSDGNPFDLFEAYTNRISPLIVANGLVAQIGRQLRPGVQMTLQTKDDKLFTLGSAILNRLAAFATILACQSTDGHVFRHIACEVVARVDGYVAQPNEPTYKLDCDGELIAADEIIIRRGTDRDSIRRPFANLLGDYERQHKDWLDRLGGVTLTPTLSNEAHDFFRARAHETQIVGSRRRVRLAAAALPLTVHLSIDGNEIRWSGDCGPDRIGEAWDDERAFDVTLAQAPDDLGLVGGAVLRVAAHAPQATVHAMPLHWSEPWKQLTAESLHGGGMLMPKLIGGDPGGASVIREVTNAQRLAGIVHRELDKWILTRIDTHLTNFFVSEDDPGSYIGLEIARDLRELMRDTWTRWHEAFLDDPVLLARFLRLVVSATDDDGDPVQVLVGPCKLQSIICGTALSLAVAAVWGETSPRGSRPGNLLRQIAGSERTGHGCAPDRILGKRSSLCAESHNWKTNFVLLALEGRFDLAKKVEETFTNVSSGQPSLAETTGSGPLMMWISNELMRAFAVGTHASAALLEEAERQHVTLLRSNIERQEEGA